MIGRVSRYSLLAGGFVLAARLGKSQVTTHLEHKLEWSSGPVANAALDARIGQAAALYRNYAPVPRVAFFDIAYPRDCSELAGMNGHAVMIVTAVAQDSTELPPARTYFQTTAPGTELPRMAGVESHVGSAAVRGVFGPFRADAVYLLPITPSLGEGDLLLDFAAHRTGFRLARLSGQIPKSLATCGAAGTPGLPPPDSVLWALVRREYPDLVGSLVPAR